MAPPGQPGDHPVLLSLCLTGDGGGGEDDYVGLRRMTAGSAFG